MSNLFKKALASMKDSKNLDTILSGSGFLDEGTYDFTIQAIDSADIDDNKLTITYTTADGKSFVDKAFVSNRDGNGWSKSVRLLLAGAIPNKDAMGKLFDSLDTDSHAFEMLTGMQLQATLKRGPGFHVRAVGTGGFAAYDTKSGEQMTDAYDDIKEARETAKAKGLSQSYVRLDSTTATHAESNLAAFEKALVGRKKGAKPSISKAI